MAEVRATMRSIAERGAEISRNKIAALLKNKQEDRQPIKVFAGEMVLNEAQVAEFEIKREVLAKAITDKVTGGAKVLNLTDFMAQNPGAESEILAYAKTKLGPSVDEAVKAESNRYREILSLAGVKITDDVQAALAGGVTPEAFAKNALLKQREIEARLQTENNLNPGTVAQEFSAQAGVKKPAAESAITDEKIAAMMRKAGRA